MEDSEDPHLWLEEIEGERALAWAREQNARTLAALEAAPLYAALHAEALAILNAPDRVPWGSIGKEDRVSNFWQDSNHVRGLWRRTTLESYRTVEPEWETILDFDELAATEDRNWVYKGGTSLPDSLSCFLVFLSDGGKDAYEFREFDPETRLFRPDGFSAPEGKQTVSWIDKDTVLIGRDWGEGTLTKSGYPYILKIWKRGENLEDAVEIFRGEPDDHSAYGSALWSIDFEIQAILIGRGLNTFESETFILDPDGPRRLPFPRRVSTAARVLVQGQLLLSLDEDWPEQGLKAGDLASCDFALLKEKNEIKSQLIFRPEARQSGAGIMVSRDKVVLGVLDNVQGTVLVCTRENGEWVSRKLDLPANANIGLMSSTWYDNRIELSVEDFLTPSAQLLLDLDTGSTELLKTAPARFDASGHVVEQFHAVSGDGTSIPYFVVRPADMKSDGSTPTLLYAYGGFQIPLTPGYNSLTGKLWLERGGIYVLANIRGGGEFGPAWHEAGRKENRQRVFDDFHAVARDLIARGITSPERLGIMGGSNGGLLMGVALTQQPQLYRAVVIHVPLLDMLRYTVMGGAGASWTGEYGDPEIPEERDYIAAYSPYQNLRQGTDYPATLIMTSTKDDRVHPGHARKFVARLQELGQQVLYYENIDGGHAGAANLPELAMQRALEFTWLWRRLGGENPG